MEAYERKPAFERRKAARYHFMERYNTRAVTVTPATPTAVTAETENTSKNTANTDKNTVSSAVYSSLKTSISHISDPVHPISDRELLEQYHLLFLQKETNVISLYSFYLTKGDTGEKNYYIVVYNKKIHAPVTIYKENAKMRAIREQKEMDMAKYAQKGE